MDLAKLNEFISEQNVPARLMCMALGISRTALFNKRSGKCEFKLSELAEFARMYRMSREEFLNLFFDEEDFRDYDDIKYTRMADEDFEVVHKSEQPQIGVFRKVNNAQNGCSQK